MARRKTRDLLEAEFTITIRVDPNDSSQTILMSVIEDNLREALQDQLLDDREGHGVSFVPRFAAVDVAATPWKLVKVPIEQPSPNGTDPTPAPDELLPF